MNGTCDIASVPQTDGFTTFVPTDSCVIYRVPNYDGLTVPGPNRLVQVWPLVREPSSDRVEREP